MTKISGARAWVLTDGKAGHLNQCLGLAAALGVEPALKRLAPRFPWSRLPPHLWFSPLRAADPDGGQLIPPWPDIVIAAGRQTVAPALGIKSASGGGAFCVQIQDPSFRRDAFDVVIAPVHDGLEGANVVSTMGALHRVTPALLRAEAEKHEDTLSYLPRPLVAVLVGGSNGQYRMTDADTDRLAAGLKNLCAVHGAGLAVTASRRTGKANEARLRDALADSACWFWDGSGANPYPGMLGLADAIVVTADSVSMISEACATGKPVYIAGLTGGSAKFDRFHRHFRDAGATRPFDGALDAPPGTPPDDVERAAKEVERRYAAFASGRRPS